VTEQPQGRAGAPRGIGLKTKPRNRGRIVTGIVLYLVTFAVLLPLIWIVLLSFQSNQKILSDPFSLSKLTLANYRTVLSTISLLSLYKNTMILVVGSVVILVVVSFMLSYALSRMVFRWPALRNVLRMFFLAGLAVPVYILLFPVYRLDIMFHLFGTYAALIVPYVAVQISFDTLLLTGFLAGFPREVEQAAVVDGCGLTKLCWYVVVPIMRPALVTVLIFNVLYAWNEFPFAVTLIQNPAMTTIALGVSQFQGEWLIDYGAMMAAATMVLIPQLIFYALFQKSVVAGMTLGAVTG
jgi:raffinose/stachyose/melibiose transport system permease protein